MNAQTVAHIMTSQNPEDSYSLAEEIAVRRLFGTKRPEYVADTFAAIYHELAADVFARARLVDIGLRYNHNIPLGLAAARKIPELLDAHKILLIPAHIDSAPPEVAEAVAKQIHTIRSDDPRRYFFERWSSHENAAVARVCRAGLASFRENGIAYTLPETRRIETNTALTLPARPTTPARLAASSQLAASARAAVPAAPKRLPAAQLPPAPGMRTVRAVKARRDSEAPAPVQPRVQPRTQPSHAQPQAHAQPRAQTNTAQPAGSTIEGADLIGLIELHLKDSRSQVRLKWIKQTGNIPARLDAEDTHKMRFITQGLRDPVQAVNLEAVAQIAFLLHDKSKLALLLLLIEVKPDLLRSAEARAVIASLGPEDHRKLETARGEERNAAPARANGSAAMAEKKQTAGTVVQGPTLTIHAAGNTQTTAGMPDKTEKPAAPAKRDTTRKQERSDRDPDGAEPEIPAGAILSGNTSRADRLFAADEKKIAGEIIAELALPKKAIDGLDGDRNPAEALIRELAPLPDEERTDNYFLRHTAVLHIKDLRTEELRYGLYLAVLRHDAKDIVRQIAVQEARNLDGEHILAMFREGLKDRAWQVRCAALDYLLPFMPDKAENDRILQVCTADSDYHVRQKAAEKLAGHREGERILR